MANLISEITDQEITTSREKYYHLATWDTSRLIVDYRILRHSEQRDDEMIEAGRAIACELRGRGILDWS